MIFLPDDACSFARFVARPESTGTLVFLAGISLSLLLANGTPTVAGIKPLPSRSSGQKRRPPPPPLPLQKPLATPTPPGGRRRLRSNRWVQRRNYTGAPGPSTRAAVPQEAAAVPETSAVPNVVAD